MPSASWSGPSDMFPTGVLVDKAESVHKAVRQKMGLVPRDTALLGLCPNYFILSHPSCSAIQHLTSLDEIANFYPIWVPSTG